MCNLWNHDNFDPTSDYIVFDDIELKNMGCSYKTWFGAQYQFSVTDKYKKKEAVTWGKPMIYLCNFWSPVHAGVDPDWINQNTVVVTLDRKMF
jgi:hypothetical protein